MRSGTGPRAPWAYGAAAVGLVAAAAGNRLASRVGASRLTALAAYATGLTWLAIHVFTRTAVQG